MYLGENRLQHPHRACRRCTTPYPLRRQCNGAPEQALRTRYGDAQPRRECVVQQRLEKRGQHRRLRCARGESGEARAATLKRLQEIVRKHLGYAEGEVSLRDAALVR